MTEQPPLPLDPPPADPAPAPAPAATPAPAVLQGARPPWWVRWMERLLQPWIEIKREPAVPPFALDRPVCYVIEHYGLSNALILDRACREAGLPSPFAPLPGDPLRRKRAYIARGQGDVLAADHTTGDVRQLVLRNLGQIHRGDEHADGFTARVGELLLHVPQKGRFQLRDLLCTHRRAQRHPVLLRKRRGCFVQRHALLGVERPGQLIVVSQSINEIRPPGLFEGGLPQCLLFAKGIEQERRWCAPRSR